MIILCSYKTSNLRTYYQLKDRPRISYQDNGNWKMSLITNYYWSEMFNQSSYRYNHQDPAGNRHMQRKHMSLTKMVCLSTGSRFLDYRSYMFCLWILVASSKFFILPDASTAIPTLSVSARRFATQLSRLFQPHPQSLS